MQISPNVAAIIKIVLALLTAITSGTLSLTGLVTPQTNALIVAGAASAITIIGIVMSAFSSSAPGVLAPADPPVVVAATKLAALPVDAPATAVTLAKNDLAAAAAKQ
jgi:hypothetical protein